MIDEQTLLEIEKWGKVSRDLTSRIDIERLVKEVRRLKGVANRPQSKADEVKWGDLSWF